LRLAREAGDQLANTGLVKNSLEGRVFLAEDALELDHLLDKLRPDWALKCELDISPLCDWEEAGRKSPTKTTWIPPIGFWFFLILLAMPSSNSEARRHHADFINDKNLCLPPTSLEG
jgi:hypothetical protein